MNNQATVDKMAQVWQSLSDLCAPFTEREWNMPTACPGWSVQDQISHMLGSEERLLGRPMPEHTPRDTSYVKNDIGQRNEIVVDWRRSWSGAQVLEAFRQVTHERLGILRAMRDEDFAAQTQTPIGPGTVSDLLQIRILDAWVHEQDIRRAVEQPGHMQGTVVEHAVGRIAMALPFVIGRKVKPADDTTVIFEITGAAGRTVAVTMQGGRAKVLDSVPASSQVRLSMDVDTFMGLGCGRFSPAEVLSSGKVQISGDTALGTTIVEQMNIMI